MSERMDPGKQPRVLFHANNDLESAERKRLV